MSSSAPPDQRAREIFLGVLETTVPEERSSYLERHCGGDEGLRQAVQAMLDTSHRLGGFLERPAAATKPLLRGEKPPSEHIGPYKLLQEIGEGGCGVVYMAEQERPVRRRVALKVIKLGMDTRRVIARFESERQALAMMDHPNIARVLEAGTTDNGRPFFVMELVRGVAITDYCDQHKLSNEDRLQLFIQVAKAIQHAHHKGIIHRDIKPSNILVTLHEGVPIPKIIDFGIAKAVDQRLTDKTLFTEFRTFVGTPAYMSPEQAEMSGLDIDTRSDIYSLGVLLYELLVGSTPFDPDTLRDAGLDECRRTLREVEPASPSQRLCTLSNADQETVAGNRHSGSMELLQRLRGDLDWIVMKCLEKDRQRRYATASELASDVRAYLNGELVSARPPSTIYRMQKAWRRHRLAFGATAFVAITLVLGISGSLWQAVRATNAEEAATRLREDAELNLAKAVRSAEEARLSAERARLNEYVADMNVANHSLEDGNLGRAWQLIQKHLPEATESDLRGFEWRYLSKQSKGDPHVSYPASTTSINDLAFSPDGSLLAVGLEAEISVWNVRDRILLTTLPRGALSLAFLANMNLLASVDGDLLRIWHANTWLEQLSLPSRSRALAVSSDGRFLATNGTGGRERWDSHEGVRLWDTTTWRVTIELSESAGALAFSPNGTDLILGRRSGIDILNIETGELVRTLELSEGLMGSFGSRSPWLAVSPDGNTIAAAGHDRATIRLWDAPSGKAIGVLPSDARDRHHTSTIATASWTPDSRTLVTGSWDHSIQYWDVWSQQHTGGLRGHRNEVWAMAMSPSGRTIASGGKDGQLLIWPLQDSMVRDEVVGSWHPISFSKDGASLAAINHEKQLAFFSTSDLTPARTIDLADEESNQRSSRVALSGDQSTIAVCNADGTIDVRRLSGQQVHRFQMDPSRWMRLSLSYSGSNLVARGADLKWWSLDQPGEPVKIFQAEQALFSDDDSTLVLLPEREASTIQVWDTKARTIRTEITLGSPIGFTLSAALSVDGSLLVIPTGPDNANHAIQLWDTQSGDFLGSCLGHKQGIGAVAFSPDGLTLASASHDRSIKLWNVETRQELLSIGTGEAIVRRLVFSPDGQWLAASLSTDSFSSGMLRLFHAPSS